MPIDDTIQEQQSRLEALIDEFKQAQHRRLVKRGLALLNGSTDTPVGRTAESSLEKIN
jgi:hypothetical protein